MNASLFSNLFIFMFFSHRLLFLIFIPTLFLLAIFSARYLYKLYIFCFSSLYSDEGLTSETSVSIRSFLRCRIYIFITKLFLPDRLWYLVPRLLDNVRSISQHPSVTSFYVSQTNIHTDEFLGSSRRRENSETLAWLQCHHLQLL